GLFKERQCIYTVPTRALANDKRREWQRAGWKRVGIATGDLAEDTDAPVVVATLETQRERLIRGEGPALLVIDEYQMIADSARGLNYELAIALAPEQTRLLLLSGSVANPEAIAAWLERLGRRPAVVVSRERPVPLQETDPASLPYAAPRSVTGFWPRLAVGVLMADMGPLLVFAPQRGSAERMARKIASALPADNPLVLTEAQRHACGAELSRLLEKRVAFHHSGLRYAARAGVVEPLAKAGQLRVVVATMGLAAGINFSMRSVVVAETCYTDAEGTIRDVAPDELLQMFGRAGRRGLDDVGHVIVTRNGPSLADAAAKHLRRSNEIDWPTLLRVMHRASLESASPFEAARALCANLFSEQRIQLGFRGREGDREGRPSSAEGDDPQQSDPARPLFGLGPTKTEIFNSAGFWEEKTADGEQEVPLEMATLCFQNTLQPALAVFHFVSHTFPLGRVCRLYQPEDGFPYFGKEVAIALRGRNRRFRLTRNIRKHLDEPAESEFSYDQLEDQVLPRLQPAFMQGRIRDIVLRDDLFAVRLDFSKAAHSTYRDSQGVYLIEPEERTVSALETPTIVHAGTDGSSEERLAAVDSPAEAWRRLGLIHANGAPTRRGVVFSFFQGGEGLAVAAALEDVHYPIEDLVLHLANLRTGRRFENFVPDPDDRLAAACRLAYGAVSHAGYLSLGLPVGYGDGGAEAVQSVVAGSRKADPHGSGEIGTGDVERVVVEWLSLLRHVRHAPEFDWDRWESLRKAAGSALNRHAQLSPGRRLPVLPA
ncbi:MAG TPA: helicase-related protein, partial [Longimicrobiaceae bacterium]|nr:helicase-related protein [Longimicrobiaceae bacterium]